MQKPRDRDRLVITDPDGDFMDVSVTYAFGAPLLAIFITDDVGNTCEDTCGINLDPAAAKRLRDELDRYLKLVAARQ